jgi:transcriptional regulator with GAF, ATPase, and Fis domain
MSADQGMPETPRSSGERADEDVNLADSLTGLATLSSAALPLKELLTRVARFAVQAIPGADGAGLTLIEAGRADTIVATADFVTAVDDVQYGLGDGPCIMAAREGRTVISRSLRDESRWGTFGAQVADMGVHSVVSLPLRLGEDVVGAMNVYAHAYDAFDERSAALGEAFAVPAAIAVQHAHVLDQTRQLAEQLQASLATRMLIEQAVGVLIGRHRIDADEARQRLQTLSAERGDSLATVAQVLVDDAVRRAAGRGTSEG